MREARIILPTADNLSSVHSDLRRKLAATFGGYTATPSYGGWIAPDGELVEEPGIAYDVAVPDNAANDLRNIARDIGHAAHQQSMYLRLPSGTVEILPTSEPMPLAA